MSVVEVLMPYPETSAPALRLGSRRLADLNGRRVGIINNSWRCMNIIADELTTRLTRDYGVVDVVEERISAAQTLPADRLKKLAEQSDAVVVGIGN
jgi:hypothetical protein